MHKILAANLTKDNFAQMSKLFEKEFPLYQIEYEENFAFWEYVPNPYFKPNQIPPDEEEISIFKTAVCGCRFQLKNISHVNFNMKCYLFEGNIYIKPAAYYYAAFNADNLKSLVEACLSSDNFTLGGSLPYDKKTYKQWVDEHLDQRWAQHNYKCDKEDLAKVKIEV